MSRRSCSRSLLLVALLVHWGCSEPPRRDRPADWQGPVARMEQETVDFGDCFAAVEKTAAFEVRNVGGSLLEIRDVQAECGCSKPELSTREIPPGEAATLTVHFLPPHPGPIRKRIRVWTSDPYAEVLTFTLQANGLGPARLEPTSIDVGRRSDPDRLVETLSLVLPDERSFVDVKFESNLPWLSVRPKAPLEGHRAEFELTIAGIPEVMDLRENLPIIVTAEDASGRRSTFGMPFGLAISGRWTPSLRAEPCSVAFGALDPRAERRREIHILSEGVVPEVEAATITGIPGARIEAAKDGADRWSIVVPAAVRPQGRFLGQASLTFRDGRRIDVPVHGYQGT